MTQYYSCTTLAIQHGNGSWTSPLYPPLGAYQRLFAVATAHTSDTGTGTFVGYQLNFVPATPLVLNPNINDPTDWKPGTPVPIEQQAGAQNPASDPPYWSQMPGWTMGKSVPTVCAPRFYLIHTPTDQYGDLLPYYLQVIPIPNTHTALDGTTPEIFLSIVEIEPPVIDQAS